MLEILPGQTKAFFRPDAGVEENRCDIPQQKRIASLDRYLTAFGRPDDPGEIDGLLALEDDEKANATPPLPETPVSARAIYGCLDRIEFCAVIRRMPRSWRDCSALWYRTRFRVSRSSGPEWSRCGRAQLYEETYQGSLGDDHLG